MSSTSPARQENGCHAHARGRLRGNPVKVPLLAAWLSICLSVPARAVDVVFSTGTLIAETSTASTRTKPTTSFSLPTQSAEVKDALEEFQRLVKHQAWEKAFKALDTITSKTASGYIDRSDGVLVPSRMLVRNLLGALPTAGKNAYRVFYDSQATALWEKAVGKTEVPNLSQIVNDHLISSVGDRAADRLGDIYFEQGDLDQAITAWRSIITYCPESKLPKAQIFIKLATGLARSGRWAEFRDIERTVRERYAGEGVELGGRRITAAEEIARLAATGQSAEVATAPALPADLDLPSEDDPLWQFRYQSKVDPLNPQQAFALVDIYGRPRANNFPIPAAADDKRVCVNLFGYEMAFDIVTGKLLWRTGKLHQLQNLQQMRQNQISPERYSIALVGDRVWSVLRDPEQLNQNPATFALTVRNAATGKEIFSSRKSLSTWSILGPPYPVGNVVYLGANRSNQNRELAVLVLNASDGKLLRTVTIGTHQVDQSQVYHERTALPSFLAYRDRLYVDTHAGALVSMQSQSGTFDWGVLYDSPPPQTGYYYNDYQPPPQSVSAPVLAAGLLFCKGMRSSRLLGVQPDGPSLAWDRPVSQTAMIVGVDQDHLYMGGEELAAYSLQTQELVWSTRLPQSAGWSVPLMTRNRLFQFTSRGICEVDKATGALVRVFRGIDLDSFGGSLLITPQALVTVSNLAITAYPSNSLSPKQTN
ncbi:MAG: PQQ-binding-like beta-propeller repeat protein [Planctomycetia bacterium]|nr:PQQ-binding-like beta-propeller repeat protein [Planctomycetia bacterium]